jgi:diphosphomevalonate decarboxylase
MYKVKVPGKIHLIGEHSVLYGKRAILSPINLTLSATIKASARKEILGINKYDNAIAKMQSLIERKISEIHGIQKIPPYKIGISTNIPIGSGLGTSASLSLAFTLCLLKFLKIKYGKEEVFKIALEGEKVFHGNPSGGDLAAVLSNRTILFKKNLDSLETVPLNIRKPLSFTLIDTGKPEETTAEMVELVRKRKLSLQKIFDNQDSLAVKFIGALESNNSEEILKIISSTEKNLEKMGVVGLNAKKIIRQIRKLGGAAKITGAGGIKKGSGMILAYHKNPNELRKFAQENDLRYYPVKITGQKVSNMKFTAKAPANIAFIKFWGKKDPKINLPFTNTLSVSLDNVYTVTTVEFSEKFKKDSIEIDGEKKLSELVRLTNHLDNIRKLAKSNLYAKVVSKNNFPNSSGLASSASGFAALSKAATCALGLNLSEKELSSLARLGSGSAARSIPGGFVEWEKGSSHASSYARTIFPPEHWDLSAIIVMITGEKKDVSTTKGHGITTTSPFFNLRIKNLPKRIKEIKDAIEEKDIKKFGDILEEECLEFVTMSLTAKPYILYWEPATIRIIKLCRKLREQGLTPYFTMDAGPQPVIYCLRKDAKKINTRLKKTEGVIKTIVCNPASGTELTDKHLF